MRPPLSAHAQGNSRELGLCDCRQGGLLSKTIESIDVFAVLRSDIRVQLQPFQSTQCIFGRHVNLASRKVVFVLPAATRTAIAGGKLCENLEFPKKVEIDFAIFSNILPNFVAQKCADRKMR